MWTLTTVLEDLGYADDLVLQPNRHQDIQQKTDNPSKTVSSIGYKVGDKKTQALSWNVFSNNPVTVNGRQLVDVRHFVYLGDRKTTASDCNMDINTRIRETNQAFAMLKPV